MKRRIFSSLLAVLSLVLVILFWKNSIMLSAFLFLVGMGTLYIWRGNKYLYLYIIVAILGPAAEIAAIKAGAWSYSNPDFLGIPYWLPFIWGEAAIYINSLIVRLKEVK